MLTSGGLTSEVIWALICCSPVTRFEHTDKCDVYLRMTLYLIKHVVISTYMCVPCFLSNCCILLKCRCSFVCTIVIMYLCLVRLQLNLHSHHDDELALSTGSIAFRARMWHMYKCCSSLSWQIFWGMTLIIVYIFSYHTDLSSLCCCIELQWYCKMLNL